MIAIFSAQTHRMGFGTKLSPSIRVLTEHMHNSRGCYGESLPSRRTTLSPTGIPDIMPSQSAGYVCLRGGGL